MLSGLIGEGEPEEIQSHFLKLLELAPSANSFEQAMIRWVGAYIDGDLAAQAQHLEIALDLSPGNQILLFNLGFTRYLMQDCTAAREHTKPLIEAQWRYPPLYVLFGTCLVEQGEFDLAKASLERSLEIVKPLPAASRAGSGLDQSQTPRYERGSSNRESIDNHARQRRAGAAVT